MIKLFAVLPILFLGCKNDNIKNDDIPKNHIQVAKIIVASRYNGNLKDFKKYSTDKAYDEFKGEIGLSPDAYNKNVSAENFIILGDTIIENVAWVMMERKNQRVPDWVRLEKNNGYWLYNLYDRNNEKSPLKKTVGFKLK